MVKKWLLTYDCVSEVVLTVWELLKLVNSADCPQEVANRVLNILDRIQWSQTIDKAWFDIDSEVTICCVRREACLCIVVPHIDGAKD